MHRQLALFLLGALLLPSVLQAQNPLDFLLRDRNRYEPFDQDERREVVRATTYEVRSTERGRGTLKLRGPNVLLDRATVTLTRDGRADIRVSGQKNYRFAGTWRRGKANQALLTITQTYDRSPASAVGSVTLRNNNIHQLYLKGESRALDGPLVLSFTAGQSADAPRRERFNLEQTRRGRGNIAMGRTSSRLSEAKIELQPDGDAGLTVYGDRAYHFSGSWARRNAQVMDLRFSRGPNKSRVDVVGSVTLAANGFSRIDLNGDAPTLGGRVRASFVGSDREHIDRRNRYRGNPAALGGTGSIRIRGKDWRINKGSVTLYQNGMARFTFAGKYPYTMDGTWFACQDPSALELEIDQLNNRPAQATGKLFIHRDGEVHGVEMDGRSDAASGPFRLSYRPAGHAEEEARHNNHRGPVQRGSLSASEVGVGQYESRATRTTLNRAKVQLRADGTALLTFSGRDTLTFAGTWAATTRDGVAQVRLSRLQNRIPVTGTATVQHRGGRVTSVSLNGTSRQRGRFDLNFRAGQARAGLPRDTRQVLPRSEKKWKFGRELKGVLEGLF